MKRISTGTCGDNNGYTERVMAMDKTMGKGNTLRDNNMLTTVATQRVGSASDYEIRES